MNEYTEMNWFSIWLRLIGIQILIISIILEIRLLMIKKLVTKVTDSSGVSVSLVQLPGTEHYYAHNFPQIVILSWLIGGLLFIWAAPRFELKLSDSKRIAELMVEK